MQKQNKQKKACKRMGLNATEAGSMAGSMREGAKRKARTRVAER